jgi:hypothetical protein
VSPTNTKLLAAIALGITFLVGGVVGIAADHFFLVHHLFPEHSTKFIVRRLDRRLHLNDQQRTQVTQIVERHRQRISGIWAGVRPAVHSEIEAANVEIDRLLTPEQRDKFAKIRLRLKHE